MWLVTTLQVKKYGGSWFDCRQGQEMLLQRTEDRAHTDSCSTGTSSLPGIKQTVSEADDCFTFRVEINDWNYLSN